MATLSLEEVVQLLEEDSDDDFEGYFDSENEDNNEMILDNETVEATPASCSSSSDSETVEATPASCSSSSGSLSCSSSASLPSSALSAVIPSFTEQSGSILDLSDKTLYEIFSILVPDDLLKIVIDQTNLYAEQFLEREKISLQLQEFMSGVGSLKAGFGRNKEIFSSSHWNGSCQLTKIGRSLEY